jgi:DNA-binding XRE family transcriptional regulator
MPFLLLNFASVFAATLLFLVHVSGVQKKSDYILCENESLKEELESAYKVMNSLREEISDVKSKLSQINSLSSE